jgi:hypothetical protein
MTPAMRFCERCGAHLAASTAVSIQADSNSARKPGDPRGSTPKSHKPDRRVLALAGVALLLVVGVSVAVHLRHKPVIVQAPPPPSPPHAVDPRAVDPLTTLSEDYDKTQQQIEGLRKTQEEVLNNYRKRSGNKLPPNVGADLTAEQRVLLVDAIKNERGNTKGLLQGILERDQRLTQAKSQLREVARKLPDHVTVSTGERQDHLHLAVDYLKTHGLSDAAAFQLVSQVNLQESLVPGFNVWMYFQNGQFGTWVTQGTATVTPHEHNQNMAVVVQRELGDLRDEVKKLAPDVADLQQLYALSERAREALQKESDASKAELRNYAQAVERLKVEADTIQYIVGCKKDLVKDQVIDANYGLTSPRGGKALQLSTTREIPFEASCVKTIKKVVLTPGRFVEKTDFSIQTLGPIGKLTILNPDRFKEGSRFLAIVLE